MGVRERIMAMLTLLKLPPLTDWLLWLGSPIFLLIPIALCLGMVDSLALLMFGFARRHHGGGFVVFFSCLLCVSSLTAFLLSEVPSARYEALVKMASKDPPMKSWVTYYLDDNQITWLEAGLLHVAYATVHPSRTVLEPEPDRNAQFIRALRHPRKEEGRP
ncbi:MAG: hypothetical protein U0236_11920 [Nitrospira sp.]